MTSDGSACTNFRDVGGYRTADGSWVRMGVAYRSGDLSKLTAKDLAELRRLGIATIYDLRTDAEVTAGPDQVPAGAKDFRENVIGTADMAKVSIASTLLVDAFFLPCFAYDLLTRRRIHPAYLVAFLLILLDQVAQATVVAWPPWISFSQALQRLVA